MATSKGTNMNSGMTEYRQSFQDHHDNKVKPKRQANQTAARESMGNKYKKNINKYDAAAYGTKKFGMKDVEHLREQGYSDKQIQKYTSGLKGRHFTEGMKLNHGEFAGKYARGDMAEGAKITDHDVGKGFNIADVNYLRGQGFSDEEIAKTAYSAVTEDGKRHGNAMSKFMDSQGMLDYYRGDWKSAKEKAKNHLDNKDDKDSGTTSPPNEIPGTPGTGDSVDDTKEIQVGDGPAQMTQNVHQDNDITTSITGNNNYVSNNQDNSIRQYGGSTRVFNYQGGDDKRTDTPVSAATMGGFYDVDDSPAKQAKFADMYSTMNRDAQKRYSDTSSIGQGAIARARNNESLDISAMDKRIKDREMYSRAKSDMLGMNLFGDMYKSSGPSWSSAEAEKAVESPDFNSMFEKYTKF